MKHLEDMNESTDNMGKTCNVCKKGEYKEMYQMDDLKGVIHCSHCSDEVDRYSYTEEERRSIVTEGRFKDFFMKDVPKGKKARSVGKQIMDWAKDRKGLDKYEDDEWQKWKDMDADRIIECPDCEDSGDDCKTCDDEGWITKDTYDEWANKPSEVMSGDEWRDKEPRVKTYKMNNVKPFGMEDIHTCPECKGEFGTDCDLCDGDGVVDSETFGDYEVNDEDL